MKPFPARPLRPPPPQAGPSLGEARDKLGRTKDETEARRTDRPLRSPRKTEPVPHSCVPAPPRAPLYSQLSSLNFFRLPSALTALHGRIGDRVHKTYRRPRGRVRIVVTRVPDFTGYVPTAAQRTQRDRLRAATAYAKRVYADPAAKARYVAAAQKLGRVPFRLAISDHLAGRVRVPERNLPSPPTPSLQPLPPRRVITAVAHDRKHDNPPAFGQIKHPVRKLADQRPPRPCCAIHNRMRRRLRFNPSQRRPDRSQKIFRGTNTPLAIPRRGFGQIGLCLRRENDACGHSPFCWRISASATAHETAAAGFCR